MRYRTDPRAYGPRMLELCQILDRMGGTAPSQSSVYMQLDYRGGSSNRFGSRAMDRTMGRGLIEIDREAAKDAPENWTPVRLTQLGRAYVDTHDPEIMADLVASVEERGQDNLDLAKDIRDRVILSPRGRRLESSYEANGFDGRAEVLDKVRDWLLENWTPQDAALDYLQAGTGASGTAMKEAAEDILDALTEEG